MFLPVLSSECVWLAKWVGRGHYFPWAFCVCCALLAHFLFVFAERFANSIFLMGSLTKQYLRQGKWSRTQRRQRSSPLPALLSNAPQGR